MSGKGTTPKLAAAKSVQKSETEKLKEAGDKSKDAKKLKETKNLKEADKSREPDKSKEAENLKKAEKSKDAEKSKETEKSEDADKLKEAEKSKKETEKSKDAEKLKEADKLKEPEKLKEAEESMEVKLKLKETAYESKEHCLQKKEQTPSKEPMESMKKTAEKVAEAHEMKTSSKDKITGETSTSNKSESSESEMIKEGTTQLTDLPYPDTEKIYKTTSDKSTSTKLEAPEAPKSLSDLDLSQISLPGKLELELPKCQELPTFGMSTSTFGKQFLPTIPCKVPSTTSQTTETTSETSTPDKTEEPEAPEVRQTSSMFKISSPAISSPETEECENPEYRPRFKCWTDRPRPNYDEFLLDKPMRAVESPEKTDSSFDEDKADEGKADEGKADEGKADEGKADEGKADEGKADEGKADEDKVDGVDIVKVGEHTKHPLDKECKKAIQERIKQKMWPPISAPDFKKRPLVLATHHMMPSLPMQLFEVFGEMIEAVTGRPVVLMYENRVNRPIIGDIDILITPANEMFWQDGELFPLSFVFEHSHNKDKSAGVYADIIVTKELKDAKKIETITDLRGSKCAIPDRRGGHTAAGLLYNDLHKKGENNMLFFNLFDADSQLGVLEMILNNQAEVGIVESPVIKSRKDNNIVNVNSFHVLDSLGPLPPYRIMVKKSLADTLNKPLITYLMNVNKYEEMLLRLLPYGVIGFAKNSEKNYVLKNRLDNPNIHYY